MKPATNTPVEAPAENKGLLSGIMKGIEGATTKARNAVGGLVVGATALTGPLVTPTAVGVTAAALTENAKGATILLGTGLTHSTISAPIKISGLADEANTLVGDQNSYLADSSRRHLDIARSAITINFAQADIGPAGGFLTITGTMNMSTSFNFDITNNPGEGYAGVNYQLLQKVTWGNNTSLMTQIGDSFDSGLRPNPGGLDFTPEEAWIGTKDFTATIPISEAGTYYLGNEFSRTETSGGGSFNGFTLKFTPVPEPSAALLVGGAIGAGLLLRRKEEKKPQ